MAASQNLAGFLRTEDLDDLLDALDDLGPLTPDDVQVVRAIIQEWRDEQAVSNLLIHSHLIPDDIRVASLVRGLDEEAQVYYILAAVVGIGGIDRTAISSADRTALRERLLGLISSDDSIVAERATVSLPVVLTSDDGPLVSRELAHPNETVRHNLLSWLLKEFDPESSPALLDLIDASGVSDDTKDESRRAIAEYVKKRQSGTFNPLDGPLLSYIPNLRDTKV